MGTSFMAKTVLIVDDEPQMLEMLRKRFTSKGYDVIVAEDGMKALEAAKAKKPHLIVLDIMLPRMDGYKVCGLLKNDDRFAKTPIILFSVKAHKRDIDLAHEVKADAYLTKLSGSKELFKRAEELINHG